MNNRLFLVIVLALFVFCSPVLAEVEVEIDHPTQIFAGSSDFIKVTVTNTGPTEWFTVSEFSSPEISKWFSDRDITSKIESGETREFLFEITPTKTIKPATYGYSILITSRKDTVEKTISTEVLERLYSGIISQLELSCEKCTDDIDVDVTVENIGTGVLDNVDLIVEIQEKQRIAVGSLVAKEVITRDVSFDVSEMTPGNYKVYVKLYIGGKLADQETKLFKVPVYKQLDHDKEITTTPIGSFVTLKVVNEGNSMDKAIIEQEIDQKWWVSYIGPAPDNTDEAWTWFATLLPGEEGEVSYVLLYWPVPILIILLAFGAILSYLHLTGVHINKTIHKLENELYITLRVKNLGGELEGAVVRDMIPNSFIVPKDFGTLKPIMRKTGRGTELLWRIGNMRAGEERVVNYTIIPRNIHKQQIILPAASIKGVRNEKTILSVSKQTDQISMGKEERKIQFRIAK